MTERILAGDCRETLGDVESGTVHCCVTSPPYFGLRAYIDDPREIGREATPEEHLANLVDVFREVRRVLRDDGTVWVNYGDAYSSSGPTGGAGKQHTNKGSSGVRTGTASGYKPKDLLSMPFRVVEALRNDGWYHRSTIVWSKLSPMPESVSGTRWERCRVKSADSPGTFRMGDPAETGERSWAGSTERYGTNKATWQPCPGCSKCEKSGGYVLRINAGRPTTSMEYVFLLTKSPSYFYNMDGNRVANSQGSIERFGLRDGKQTRKWETTNNKNDGRDDGTKSNEGFRQFVASGRNLWTVWDDIKQSNYKGAHFATMPLDLALRCVKLGTSDYGCCPTCGAQWAPVVEGAKYEPEVVEPGVRNVDASRGDKTRKLSGKAYNEQNQQQITEWRPTCTCKHNEGGRPVVLDPFGGSLTTADAARECGCDSICCELSEEYVALGKKRVEQGVFL